MVINWPHALLACPMSCCWRAVVVKLVSMVESVSSKLLATVPSPRLSCIFML